MNHIPYLAVAMLAAGSPPWICWYFARRKEISCFQALAKQSLRGCPTDKRPETLKSLTALADALKSDRPAFQRWLMPWRQSHSRRSAGSDDEDEDRPSRAEQLECRRLTRQILRAELGGGKGQSTDPRAYPETA